MRRTILCRCCRALLVALALAATNGCGGSTQPPQVAPYLREVVGLMRLNSLHRKEINWNDFETQVYAAGSSATTISELDPALGLALKLLGDHHSFIQKANGAIIVGNPLTCVGVEPVGIVTPADVGYVRVPSFEGTSEEAQHLADMLQESIRRQDNATLKGWVIDLRNNPGGNMWPMLAGVGPVLGEGIAGYGIDADGVETSWSYLGGAAYLGGSIEMRATQPYAPLKTNPYVAVLTDNGTASSGEAIAVSFRGRARARSFGTATCGLSTGNAVFTLPDAALLFLTIARDYDRIKTAYGAQLQPDEAIDDPNSMITRAVQWLEMQ